MFNCDTLLMEPQDRITFSIIFDYPVNNTGYSGFSQLKAFSFLVHFQLCMIYFGKVIGTFTLLVENFIACSLNW